MATSSITDSFTISEKRSADAFVDALDHASRRKPARSRTGVVAQRLVGKEAVQRFLAEAGTGSDAKRKR